MQSQKLCLKWNNHTSNLLSVLGSFQQNESLVDVTISCEGHNIKAHKIVLSACSPYFQDIFLENPCKHPIIFMNGMKFEDVAAILNFMYKGEVNVSHDGLSSFLQAAEALKVKGLAEVCGEKHSTNSISQEVQQSEQNRPQRTDTPPRKRQRNRKRSLSDSNRSDDEGSSRKHREPSSPEVHELSGDESFTGDNSSNGTPFNSTPRVPQKAFSRSHQSSNLGDEDDYEMEAEKLLEQNMTTESASVNNSTDNNLRIERIMGNATEMESSSLQEPESPPDIKPIINFGESSTGASEGALMPYNEQSQFSQPGPSSASDSTLLHDNSHAQDVNNAINARNKGNTITHTCETTQLLSELKENAMCICQLNDTNFVEVAAEKNKQLIIYNEEGYMKGFEVDKYITTDVSSDPQDFEEQHDILLDRLHETGTSDDIGKGHSNISPPQKSSQGLVASSVPLYKPPQKLGQALVASSAPLYKPPQKNSMNYEQNSHINALGTDTSKMTSLMPQFYPQHVEKKTVGRKRKGKRGPKKGQTKKSKSNASSPKTCSQRFQNNDQRSLQTTYTQVSVEEVHLSKAVGRPRRNVKKKSASEMLMLKRRIVTSSIEYNQCKSNTPPRLVYPCALPKFSPAVKKNIDDGTVHQNYARFVRECAAFLLTLVDQPTKREYDIFCRTLAYHYDFINESNMASDPYAFFKKSLSRCIRNSRHYNKKLKSDQLEDDQVIFDADEDSEIFKRIQNSSQIGTLANPTAGNQIVKHVAPKYHIGMEKYGPDLLPPGWDVQVVTRKTGKTAGNFDIYFVGPDGKRLRSRIELASYLEENGLPYSPEEFCFRKGAYKNKTGEF